MFHLYKEMRFLGLVGGLTVKETIRAVLNRIMNMDIVKICNWKWS